MGEDKGQIERSSNSKTDLQDWKFYGHWIVPVGKLTMENWSNLENSTVNI